MNPPPSFYKTYSIQYPFISASQDAQEVTSVTDSDYLTPSGITNLTEVTLVSDNTFHTFVINGPSHDHLCSVIQ